MATPAAPQPPKSKPTQPVQQSALAVALSQAGDNIKLVFRLLGDHRVSFWLKLLPFSTIIYFIFPDLMPGPVDDAVAMILGSTVFISLCPPWVVAEHRAAIEAEAKGEKPQPKPAAKSTPPPHTSVQPTVSQEVGKGHVVAIHHASGLSFFHLSAQIIELINKNRSLRKALEKLGDLNGDIFTVTSDKEGDAVIQFSNRVNGLKIVYPKTKS
jgi:hypothetical protein